MCVCPELHIATQGPESSSEVAPLPGLERREGPLLPARVKLDSTGSSLPAQARLASVLPLPHPVHPGSRSRHLELARVSQWVPGAHTPAPLKAVLGEAGQASQLLSSLVLCVYVLVSVF